MDVISSLLFCILIATISLLLYLHKRNLNYWKDRGIPHEEPHFLLGNMKGVRSTHQIGEVLGAYYRQFKGTGPFAGIFIVQRPAVVLLDKSLIKNVLMEDFNNFTDRGLYHNEKADPLTGNLFLINGTKWKNLRHKLTPVFTSSKLQLMFPILLKRADQLKEVLTEKIKLEPVVNVKEILIRFTIDNVCSYFLGIESNSLANPSSEFVKIGEKSLTQPRHHHLVMGLIDGFPQLAHWLGMRIVDEDVHQFFIKVIRETISYREEHEIQRNDFLNILLELKNKKHAQVEDLKGFSFEDVCAQAFLFFLEGFETSSSLITYALYELAKNQDFQDILRQDIQQATENSPDDAITYESLKDMTYVDQVLSETLRKYPVMPVIYRQALNDYVVPGSPQYVIKKDMQVFVPTLGLHRDPDFYPDPESFDPERFARQKAGQRESMEYLPFGDGPRKCIGDRFGRMQSRLGLAYLITHFRFTTCSKTEMPLRFNPQSSALVSRNPVYLRAEDIKSSHKSLK